MGLGCFQRTSTLLPRKEEDAKGNWGDEVARWGLGDPEIMGTNGVISVTSETPEDIATLYSWANLQGAKYRDFSAARARVRENARQRVQEAMESERERVQQGESQAKTPEALPNAAVPGTPSSADTNPFREAAGAPAIAQAQNPAPVAAPIAPQFDAVLPVDAAFSSRATSMAQSAVPLAQSVAVPQWFALKNILTGAPAAAGTNWEVPTPLPARVPVVAVFSLAGGVGKSSLVATLGRSLSSRGERVLLVDTAAFGTLQFFFGAQEQRLGVLRTFQAPAAGGSAPVDILTLEAEGMEQENSSGEPLTQEIMRNARSASRILIDLSTASGATVRRILRMSPAVLIPVTPDVRSVASVGAIESFFRKNPSGTGQTIAPVYVLNLFDEGSRLHLDVREMLRSQLGERLLPIVLHRTPAVSEALAEGMTVVDYAPGSPVARDYETLAEWIRILAAPAEHVYRAVRWSER